MNSKELKDLMSEMICLGWTLGTFDKDKADCLEAFQEAWNEKMDEICSRIDVQVQEIQEEYSYDMPDGLEYLGAVGRILDSWDEKLPGIADRWLSR